MGVGVLTAEELLYEARKQGVVFVLAGKGKVRVSGPMPLPDPLMAELRKHKLDIIPLLAQGPDYLATACICEKTPDGTGPERCGVCGLPLICPVCSRCRGCRLMMKFKDGQYRR